MVYRNLSVSQCGLVVQAVVLEQHRITCITDKCMTVGDKAKSALTKAGFIFLIRKRVWWGFCLVEVFPVSMY